MLELKKIRKTDETDGFKQMALNDVSLDTPIIVYCKSGTRSNNAYNSLKDAGYKHIYDLGSINNCNK